MTLPHPEPAQAKQPNTAQVTVKSVPLGLTITPPTTEEAEHPAALQQSENHPEHPDITLPYSELAQGRHTTGTKVAVVPVDLGLTITPPTPGPAQSSQGYEDFVSTLLPTPNII